jgi:hypothetical protein
MAGGGFNVDEMKRQQQYMTMRAEQKLNERQKMDYTPETHRTKTPKDAIITIGVILGVALVLVLLSRGGII